MDEVIKTALDRFKHCEEAEAQNRSRALGDLQFSLGDQWPDDVRRAREGDADGGRPCLTVDKLDQYVRQVVNDSRQNKPGIKVRPKDDGADVDTAEMIQGLVRQIEDQSSADIAYDTAVEMATRAGFGFIRVVTDYANDEGFLQDIFIRPVVNPFTCYLDPDRMMPDGSDAKYGFAFEDIPRETFERDYPGKDPCEFEQCGPDLKSWTSEKTVRIAEYFECVYEAKKVYQKEDGSSSDEEIPGAKSRSVQRKKIIWRKITCKEVLEKQEWPSHYIPIVPVYGHLIDVAGDRQFSSLIRAATDAQRMYNYAASAFVERVALTPKAPYVATVKQIEGHEHLWESANTANLSVLPYNPDPQAPGAPQRQQAADLPTGWVQVMQGMEHDIQSALGMYNAAIGAPSNEKSGKAILARQREADNSTFHIIDNLSRAIRQVGRIIIDLIPKIYDTDRVVRILGEDGSEDFARINPQQQQPMMEVRDLQGRKVETIYNPGMGRYDVTVTVGPAYGTKRQEAAETLTQVIQSAPNMMPIIGDLMFKSMDIPYAQEIAERLQKMMPEQLKGEDDQLPPQVQQAMQQMQQAFQQSQEAAAQLADELAKAHEELKAKDGELAIKEYQAETDRMKELAPALTPEQIQMLVIQTVHDVMTQHSQSDPMPMPMGAHMMPDGSVMPDDQMPPEMAPQLEISQ